MVWYPTGIYYPENRAVMSEREVVGEGLATVVKRGGECLTYSNGQ